MTVYTVSKVNSIENIIDNTYSKYLKLIYTTARLIAIFRYIPQPSLTNAFKVPADYISEAELIWIVEAQKLLKEGLNRGDYKRLCPRLRDDGVVIVSVRLEEWFFDTYNSTGLILLPYNHRFSRLYVEFFMEYHIWGHHQPYAKFERDFGNPPGNHGKCNTKQMCEMQETELKSTPAFYNVYVDFLGRSN